MPGERALLLLLLALLPPAPAQPQGAGGRGAAPAAVPLPPPLRRAPRGRWPPAAVAVPSKAGECPAGSGGLPRPSRLYCLSDHSCPGAEKCCDAGQSRTCLLPATGTTTAPGAGPEPGRRAGSGREPEPPRQWPGLRSALPPGCGVQRASPFAVSPGYCPAAGSAGTDTCGTSCHNDTACGPGQKCCSLGCCTRCVGAQPAKPGFCPRKRALRSGAACANQCADDRGCPGTHKCCFSGCGLACTPPYAAKPGACPVVLRGSLGPCAELCHGDGDCPGTAKCCSTGCGRICKPPMEASQGTMAQPGQADPGHPFPCQGWGAGAACRLLGCRGLAEPGEGLSAAVPARAAPAPQPQPVHPSLRMCPVRPGLCPPAATGDPATGCLALCLEDKDCPPGQKCCLLHCGRACVPPLWGSA
ncbi:WAP four-disulfide core domain protein 3 [Apteryx mantelli]|uniref:WAP four-disulfide core domain protein 3 n=1 Tax=Apteryx mantelli TaxID=2696672 RepID=A0ABM4FGK9_9AVES